MKATVALSLLAGVLLAGCADPYKHEFYPIAHKQDVSLEDYNKEFDACKARADEEAGENLQSAPSGVVSGAGAAGAFAGGFAHGFAQGMAEVNWQRARSRVIGRCMHDYGYVYRRMTREDRMELDQIEVGPERRKAWWMFVSGQRPTVAYPDDETDINRKIREGTL